MSTEICPSDKIVFDEVRGEYICTETGEVIEERVIDQGPDWRKYTDSNKKNKVHAAYINKAFLDNDIGTYSFSQKLTKKTLLVRIQPFKGKTYRIYKTILLLASQYNLPEAAVEEAVQILRNRKLAHEKIPDEELAYAIVYVVAKKYGIKLETTPKLKLLTRLSKLIDMRYDYTKIIPSLLEGVKQKYGLTDEEYIELYRFIKSHMKLTNNTYLYVLALTFIWLKMKDKEDRLAHFSKLFQRSETSFRNVLQRYIKLFVKCGKCGHILFKYPSENQKFIGILTLGGIALLWANACPQCNTKINYNNVKIEIM